MLLISNAKQMVRKCHIDYKKKCLYVHLRLHLIQNFAFDSNAFALDTDVAHQFAFVHIADDVHFHLIRFVHSHAMD